MIYGRHGESSLNKLRNNWFKYNVVRIYETKYSRMDQVNFLKAVCHKIYLVHS